MGSFLGWRVLEVEYVRVGFSVPFCLTVMWTHSSKGHLVLLAFNRDLLRSSDLGCHIGSTYIGCLAYADDFILLSGSVTQLQDMHKLSSAHAEDLHIKFNATKSCFC